MDKKPLVHGIKMCGLTINQKETIFIHNLMIVDLWKTKPIR